MQGIYDCIAAISTPPGKGGVAVIRMTGDGAFDIAERAFLPISGKKLSDYPERCAVYGRIVSGGEVVDDGIATRFPHPASYTGEDTVEISCHGGILVTRAVLEVLLSLGARLAEAGEFTRRAHINGRLSLTEAEAIGSLLEARSREEIRLNSSPAREKLYKKIEKIRASLTELLSSAFARIDYPDEDLGELDDSELLARLYNIKEECVALLATYRTGRAVSFGIPTAIVGKPNVGKSTLYNLLVGDDAAIVTDVPGTTRDLLTSVLPLGRVLLRLTDTAGIRSNNSLDAVERIGIEKSRKVLKECELLFTVFDISRSFDSEDEELLGAVREACGVKIAILNKSDLEEKFDRERLSDVFDATIEISARDNEREAHAALSSTVEKMFLDEKIVLGSDAVISTARQSAALTRAIEFLSLAGEALEMGLCQDAAASDIERALGAVAELDGREVSEEVVSGIFSKFCVGK